MSKFTFVGSFYIGEGKVSDCEYSAELSGTYGFGVPLELKMTGSTKPLGSEESGCLFGSETLSGTFTVTSGGSSVEATH